MLTCQLANTFSLDLIVKGKERFRSWSLHDQYDFKEVPPCLCSQRHNPVVTPSAPNHSWLD